MRPFRVAAAASVAFLAPTLALAAPQALTIEVLPDTPEIDATSLSEAVADELAGPDEDSPAPLKIVVWVDHETNELVVEIRNKGLRISRRVPAPGDPAELKRIAVFLIGNLARDQASKLLAGLRPNAEAPVEEAPRVELSAIPHPPPPPPLPPARRRFWFGVWGELDYVSMRSAPSVCPQSNPSSADYCTSGGSDAAFPGFAIDTQREDSIQGGIARSNTRLLLSAEYAVTGNLLLGGRVGYVFDAYSGDDAKREGRSFPPIHLEARATFVFGDDPMFHASVAPYVMGSLGLAQWSAHTDVLVVSQTAPGTTTQVVQGWQLGGPGFVAAGGGLRFAFSGSAALLAGLRFTVAFGSSNAMVALGPEAGLQLGF